MVNLVEPCRMIRCFTLPMIGTLMLLVSGTASTQTTYGLIGGSITDTVGGALAGATVTVTQRTTGFVRTVETNELGLYRALNLNPGEYRRDNRVERVRESDAHSGPDRRRAGCFPQPHDGG